MCRRRCCSIRRRRQGWLALADALRGFAGSRNRVRLLALPLCGAAVTFFAAEKKATKETALPIQSASCRPRHRRLAEWPGSSECPHKTRAAWIAHGLTLRAARGAGLRRKRLRPAP